MTPEPFARLFTMTPMAAGENEELTEDDLIAAAVVESFRVMEEHESEFRAKFESHRTHWATVWEEVLSVSASDHHFTHPLTSGDQPG